MQQGQLTEAHSLEQANCRSDIGSAPPRNCNFHYLESSMAAAGSSTAAQGSLHTKPEASARPSDVNEPSGFNVHASKPTKNLSAYNFYFKDQRQKMLENLPIRPEGKPRRSHGKIGFSEMARTIAAGWKSIDADTRNHYEKLAMQDKERYTREMEGWKGTKEAQEKRKRSSYRHFPALAVSYGTMEGVRNELNGSPPGASASPFTEVVQSGAVESLHLHAQHLHASLQASSQQAIEQLARPMRTAASLPNIQHFASAVPPNQDHLPATSSLPSFLAAKVREPPSSNQVLFPSILNCNTTPSWGAPFEYVPGGFTLLRQAEGTREALSPYVMHRHSPPLPFPPPDALSHDVPSSTTATKSPPTSPLHVTESSNPAISILAKELDNESVEFFLDIFRKDNPNKHTT